MVCAFVVWRELSDLDCLAAWPELSDLDYSAAWPELSDLDCSAARLGQLNCPTWIS